MQKEKESVHQDDHHPAELVEQSLGTVKFTKTILKPLIFDAKRDRICSPRGSSPSKAGRAVARNNKVHQDDHHGEHQSFSFLEFFF